MTTRVVTAHIPDAVKTDSQSTIVHRYSEPHQYFAPLIPHLVAIRCIASLRDHASRAESSHEFMGTAVECDSPLT